MTGPGWSDAGGCLVAMYHYVRDTARTPFPDLKALAPADFDRQLDWIGSSHRVIGYEEFLDALQHGRPLDGAALLTFDDGFTDHDAPVSATLKARGWSGVFFMAGLSLDDPPRLLNVHRTHFLLARLGADGFAAGIAAALTAQRSGTDGLAHRAEVYRYDGGDSLAAKHLLNYELPFDVADAILADMFARHLGDEEAFARALYLSHAQICRMADDGMTFGFHTQHHRVLSRLGREAQLRELRQGVDCIRALTGQSSVPMCYPYGHRHTYNADTLDVLEECGYSMAFNTVRARAVPGTHGRFELPRFDTRDLPPFAGVHGS